MDPSWVQGELGGPGQLLPQPPAASSTRGAAAKAHPVSVLSALKHGQAPSSPRQCAVLCERAISHTRAPACMLRMRAEANTDTGTNISSCPWQELPAPLCMCAEANTKGVKPPMWVHAPCAPQTHVRQCAHVMHPKCKSIAGVYTRMAVSHTSMQLREPTEMLIPCAHRHSQRWSPPHTGVH